MQDGIQVWKVLADSEEEALQKFKKEGGEFQFEELEVTALGDPHITEVDGKPV